MNIWIVLLIILIILLLYKIAFDHAPEGYEDESGYHNGKRE